MTCGQVDDCIIMTISLVVVALMAYHLICPCSVELTDGSTCRHKTDLLLACHVGSPAHLLVEHLWLLLLLSSVVCVLNLLMNFAWTY